MAAFPIPVLGNGQDNTRDVMSEWNVCNPTFAPGTEDITIKFRIRSDDPDLKELIQHGDARIVAKWRCSATITSGYLDLEEATTHSDGITYSASLDQRMVLGTVTVDVFVCATRPIHEFHWRRQHDDYGDQTFEIRTGDMLSVPSRFFFNPAKLYDPQNPPFNSIFRIVGDPRLKRGIQVDYSEDDQIIITLPDTRISQLQMLESPNLQLSILVLPVLIDTIDFIRENSRDEDGENLASRTWYQTIVHLMEAQKLSYDDRPLTIAQKLLSNPIDAYAIEREKTEEEEA